MSVPTKTSFQLEKHLSQYTDWQTLILMYFSSEAHKDVYCISQNEAYAKRKFRKKFNIPKSVKL